MLVGKGVRPAERAKAAHIVVAVPQRPARRRVVVAAGRPDRLAAGTSKGRGVGPWRQHAQAAAAAAGAERRQGAVAKAGVVRRQRALQRRVAVHAQRVDACVVGATAEGKVATAHGARVAAVLRLQPRRHARLAQRVRVWQRDRMPQAVQRRRAVAAAGVRAGAQRRARERRRHWLLVLLLLLLLRVEKQLVVQLQSWMYRSVSMGWVTSVLRG